MAEVTVGQCQVDTDANQISGNGRTSTLAPKSSLVLELLVLRAGETVTNEELLSYAWDQDYIGDNAVHKAISELRRCFADCGGLESYIETVRGRGYRLVELPGQPVGRRRSLLWVPVIVICVVAVGLYWWQTSDISQPDAKKTVVLGLEPAGGGADYPYIGVGIVNAIAATREVRVPHPQKIGKLRSAGADALDIGRTLGAEQVLSGQFVVENGQARITLFLDDVIINERVWTGQVTESLSDVFVLEDKVVALVHSRLSSATPGDGVRSLRGTDSAPAYLAYLQAQYGGFACPAFEASLEHFEEALRLDPGFANAKLGAARVMTLHGRICAPNLQRVERAHRMMQEAVASPRVDPVLRDFALAVTSSSPDEELARYGEIYALPGDAYNRHVMNALERPMLIEEQVAVRLAGAGFYGAAKSYSERAQRLIRSRDGVGGNDPASDFPMLPLFMGDYDTCLKGIDDTDARMGEDKRNPLNPWSLYRLACAVALGRSDVLDTEKQRFSSDLDAVADLAEAFGIPQPVAERRLRLKLDAIEMERLLATARLEEAQARFPTLQFIGKPVLGDYERYFLLRLADTNELLEILEAHLGPLPPLAPTHKLELRGWVEQLRPELLKEPRLQDILRHYGADDESARVICRRVQEFERFTGIPLICET